MELLRRIEKYLKRSGTPATRFGREAVHDPRFVLDLRNGREPRGATQKRVHSFIDQRETGL
jgi:hypothetical protein